MTSDKLFNLADTFAGKARRKEPLSPEGLAMVADILREFAEMTALMEQTRAAFAPEVANV